MWQVQQTNTSAPMDTQRFHATPQVMLKHGAPVLSLAMSSENRLATGGCDNLVKIVQWGSGSTEMTALGKHDAPVKFVHFCDNNTVMSGSWDKTIKYWDVRNNNGAPIGTVTLQDRVYAADVRGQLAVIGCANRRVALINLANPYVVFKEEESPLKLQTRCVSCFQDQFGQGYAIGSIEGRVGIQHLTNSTKTFAYKCHRSTEKNAPPTIYSVNNIRFHPAYGTFVTAGSDGTVVSWDKEARSRLHGYNRVSQQVVDLSFNADGNILAVVDSYDWSSGPKGYNKSIPSAIYLTHPGDQVKPKAGRV